MSQINVGNFGPTFTPVEDVVAHWCGIRGQTLYLIWWLMLWGQLLTLNPN